MKRKSSRGGEVAKGLDPITEQRAEEARSVTLRQVNDDYLAVRKGLRPKTIGDYEHVVARDFADWCNRPLISITKDAVAKRHMRLGQRSAACRSVRLKSSTPARSTHVAVQDTTGFQIP